ncbi:hypothetical protein LMK19_001832 [Listeria monocytogenes]|uniref:ArpU family phage packaging/lysis transcriptional regulator n=1 Tax=Listeria monocytogenes TaxID=1639 RepID=UPI000F200115|nr:ArpU family phage packaging/lysis transcriptional regulator [Listeria monocytogenes]EAC8001174.1 hypothetical protein [Listeria monocytogenes]EAC8001217.1 hypothetical protein [Listeria monocytogenes]EIL9238476.1 hypothetical protein [Listeria monocytogenes]EJC6460060.1 hypothetical protein [Listeria monocytogenes]EJT8453819.1 hypothetical protein [Listeria monocytogenes]
MALFELPQIDNVRTKKNVIKALEKYKMMRVRLGERRTPKLTSTLTIVPPSFGNEFHSTTEESAIWNVDAVNEAKAYVELMDHHINQLPDRSRQIIITKFMEEHSDYDTMLSIHVSHSQYKEEKRKAIERLAYQLNIVVEK